MMNMDTENLTVRDAVEMLNEQVKPNGFAVIMIPTDRLDYDHMFGGEGGGDALHYVLKQTDILDKHWAVERPSKPEDPEAAHTVTMQDREWACVMNALEVYNDVLHQVYKDRFEDELKKAVTAMAEKMGDKNG